MTLSRNGSHAPQPKPIVDLPAVMPPSIRGMLTGIAAIFQQGIREHYFEDDVQQLVRIKRNILTQQGQWTAHDLLAAQTIYFKALVSESPLTNTAWRLSRIDAPDTLIKVGETISKLQEVVYHLIQPLTIFWHDYTFMDCPASESVVSSGYFKIITPRLAPTQFRLGGAM